MTSAALDSYDAHPLWPSSTSLDLQTAVPDMGGLPLLGALPRFLHNPLATLQQAQQVGDVSRVELGFIDAITLHHADHVDHVLHTHQANYTQEGPLWASVRDLLGTGLPTHESPAWQQHRQMLRPPFHRKGLAGLGTLMVEALDQAMRWHDVSATWSTLDVGARMPHLAMNAASAALMGLHTSRPHAERLAAEISYAQRHVFHAILTHRVPRWVPIPGRHRYERSVFTIREEIQHIIDHRRRTGGGRDLLGLLLDTTDDAGVGMTNAELLDETMSLFLTGYQSTSGALQWCLALLGQHPEIWGRLREECDAALRGRLPKASDLRRLRYAREVVMEAMRLYPSVWWLPRVAAHDDEIDGHFIPRGATVAPITVTVHRHPELWDDPERFDPERFEPSRATGRHPMAWCPFGAGPHTEMVQEISLMESTLALAMFTQRYDIAAAGPMPQVEVRTTLRPADGVQLKIRRRATH